MGSGGREPVPEMAVEIVPVAKAVERREKRVKVARGTIVRFPRFLRGAREGKVSLDVSWEKQV